MGLASARAAEAGRRPESCPVATLRRKRRPLTRAPQDELDGVGREGGLERRNERFEVGVARGAEGDRVDQETGHLLTGTAF